MRIQLQHVIVLLLLLSGIMGCQKSSQTPPKEPAAEASAATDEHGETEEERVAAQISTLVGRLPPGAFGPYLLQGRESRLALWAVDSGAASGFYALELPFEESPRAKVRFADCEGGLERLSLGRLIDTSVAVLSSRSAGQHHVLELHHIAPQGNLLAGPRVIAETPSEYLWLKVVPTSEGAFFVWAEKSRDAVDIRGRSYAKNGDMSPSVVLARQADAWQLQADSRGVFLLTTEENDGQKRVALRGIDGTSGEVLLVQEVEGALEGALDLDFALSKTEIAVAYSVKGGQQGRIRSALFNLSGKRLAGPHYMTAPRSEQHLLALISHEESEKIFALWEEPEREFQATRSFWGARLASDGRALEPEFSFLLSRQDPLLPQLAARGGGLQLITAVPGDSAEDVHLWVDIDETQLATQSWVITGATAESRAPDMVWSLGCSGVQGRRCSALGAQSGSPTMVWLEKPLQQQRVEEGLLLKREEALPRLRAQRILGRVDELTRLVGQKRESVEDDLLAWVTFFDPQLPYTKTNRIAPDGRRAPVRAQLTTATLEGIDGESPAQREYRFLEKKISVRARSLGGIALSEANTKKESVVAWAAIDGKYPQVFVTLIDSEGTKIRQRMMTKSRGEITDVAISKVKGGYVLAWVLSDESEALIYKQKIDERLKTLKPAAPLSAETRFPTGLSLTRLDDGVLLVWSDSIGAAEQGHGDIYSIALSPKTGREISPAHRIIASADHSFAPQLAPLGRGHQSTAILGFIESKPGREQEQESLLKVAEIDLEGRFIASRREIGFDGEVRSFGIECLQEDCHLAIALDRGQAGELWGATLSGSKEKKKRPLTRLDGPPSEVVSPIVLGDRIYYVDADLQRSWLLRRLDVEW
ncbi:MAG: hypothetical protein MK135_02175 [Polyangiaceae bacterium]|nr:hypothetical protein [Polyangiaceae bacterium]